MKATGPRSAGVRKLDREWLPVIGATTGERWAVDFYISERWVRTQYFTNEPAANSVKQQFLAG